MEFGMELDADEEGMIRDLDDFHETIIGRGTGDDEAGIDELLAIIIIEFVTMAMTLGDLVGGVDSSRDRSSLEITRIRTESQRPTDSCSLQFLRLIVHQMNHRILRL